MREKEIKIIPECTHTNIYIVYIYRKWNQIFDLFIHNNNNNNNNRKRKNGKETKEKKHKSIFQ